MRRRAISALAAALALVLTLVTPALAAGRPNWDGPLGAMAGPVVCETGRDYVLYYTIIGGVPAKPIRKRFTPETIHRLERLRWWDWPREKLQLLLPLLRRGDLTALERAAEKF